MPISAYKYINKSAVICVSIRQNSSYIFILHMCRERERARDRGLAPS